MKKSWQPMQVKYVGLIREIVRLGGGKLSLAGGDTGEPRKTSGIETF